MVVGIPGYIYMWVFPKIGEPPQIDGLFHGKPYEQMDDFGFFPYFGNTHVVPGSPVSPKQSGWSAKDDPWSQDSRSLLPRGKPFGRRLEFLGTYQSRMVNHQPSIG